MSTETSPPRNERQTDITIKQRLLYGLDGLDDGQFGFLLLSPLLAVLALVIAYPLFQTFYISLFKLNINKPWLGRQFVGFQNYVEVLSSGDFHYAIGFTLLFTIVTVFSELVLGLLAALILARKFRGRGIMRTAILLPWAIPLVVQGLLWKFIFNANYGLANSVLLDLGLVSHPILWLGNTVPAAFVIFFNDIWKTFPFMALIILAGLQTIDQNLYRAARVDGANRWEQFRYVSLPLLRNHIIVALLFRTIAAMKVFGIIYIMTGGGPANSTMSVSILTIRRTFDQLMFGQGAAMGVLIVLLIAPFLAIYLHYYGVE